MSLEAISEDLTHSDTGTTQIYVNTSNVVPMAVGDIAYRNLKSNGVNFTLWKHLPSNLYLPNSPHQTFDKKHFIRQHLLYHIHQLIQFDFSGQ